MGTFNAGAIEATLELDVDPFQRGIRWARNEGRTFSGEKYEAQLGVDTAAANGQLAVIRRELEQVATGTYTARIELDGGAAVMAMLNYIGAQLDELGLTSASPRVELDGGAAMLAELAALEASLHALGAGRHTANVDADTSGFTSSIGGATSSMSGLIAAAILLAPALIPGLVGATAAAGGLTSALMAAGGALAVLGAGVIGNVMQVIGAQKDLTKTTDAVKAAAQAAEAAQVGSAAATRGVQNAEQALANARRSAAQQVAAAEYQLGAAQRAAGYAQEALNQARKDAADRLAEYRDQLRGAALDEEASELAVRRAYRTLQQTLADPNATKLDRDEARQAYQEALFNMDQVRESRDDLQKEAKKAREAGVRGDAQVIAARRALRDANHQVQASQQALDNARRSGAQQVAAAEQALADAQRSQSAASDASSQAAAKLADAQSAQAAALRTLSTPAAMAFTDALQGAKDAWHDFLAQTEGPSLGIATRALELFAKYLPDLVPVATAAADAVGHLFDRFDAWAQGGGMDAVVDFLVKRGPDMIESFGIILGNLAEWFGGVAEAFAPFAEKMMQGLEDITGGWADWAGGLEHNNGFQTFIDYALEYGPLFLDTLGSIWDGLVQIGKAVAPAGVAGLKVLRSVFDTIAGLDPVQIDAVAVGIAAVMLALGVGEVAAAAIAIVAIVSAFSQLADNSPALQAALGPIGTMLEETFGWLEDIAGIIGDEWMQAWEDVQPQLSDLADTLTDDLQPAMHDFWETFGPILTALAHGEGPRARAVLLGIIYALDTLATGLAGSLEFLTGTFSGDWGQAWRGLRKTALAPLTAIPVDWGLMWASVRNQFQVWGGWLSDEWHGLWDGIEGVASDSAGWVLDHTVRGPDSLIGRMKSGFRTGIDHIAGIWDDLRAAAAEPVKFVVDTIYNNGIVKMFNAIPGVTDLEPVDTSEWNYASGGILPGFTPGRDVHRFVSPTAGVLNLSGGEAVMRPEFSHELGPAGVAKLNKMAMSGQLGILKNMLNEQSHATGGIVYVDGEPMSRVAAAQLAVAERHSGIPMSVIQGSYQAPSSYSGTSHTGGGVMDTAPGSFAAQAALREAWFAAWGRNFSGAAYAGSGAHVHSVSRIDPTAAGNSQVAAYNAGGDGLGGRDYGPRPPGDPLQLVQIEALLGSGATLAETSGGGGFHIGNPMSKWFDAVDAAKDFATKFPDWMKELDGMSGWGPVMVDAAKSLGQSAAQYVNDKIPDKLLPDNPIPTGIFDNGGWLEPGAAAQNHGDTPEAVLTEAQWRALAGVALAGGRDGLSPADVDRIVKAIEDNRGLVYQGRDTADARDAFELLAFELRK